MVKRPTSSYSVAIVITLMVALFATYCPYEEGVKKSTNLASASVGYYLGKAHALNTWCNAQETSDGCVNSGTVFPSASQSAIVGSNTMYTNYNFIVKWVSPIHKACNSLSHSVDSIIRAVHFLLQLFK